jgi:hypothetical protein
MAWLGAGQSPSSRTAGPQITHCKVFPMLHQLHQLYTTILCIHMHIRTHNDIYTHAYITLMLARRAHCVARVPPCNCSGDSAAVAPHSVTPRKLNEVIMTTDHRRTSTRSKREPFPVQSLQSIRTRVPLGSTHHQCHMSKITVSHTSLQRSLPFVFPSFVFLIIINRCRRLLR